MEREANWCQKHRRIDRCDPNEPVVPQDPATVETAEAHARVLGERLRDGLPEGWAFGLVMFQVKPGGDFLWTSNVDRSMMAIVLKRVIKRWEDAK